jgi:serine/threonine-protein kinase
VLYEMLTGDVPFRGENQVAVAMKHVREAIPDVQSKRPEVSAAVAGVVEKATAKRLDQRYADDAELIADLEDVLALEAARSGASAGGQATSVLRTLPSSSRRRLPLRLRRPVVAIAVALVVAGLVAAAVGYLATRTHHGTGLLRQPAPPQTPHQVNLCQSCAHDYNPEPISGPPTQNPGEAGLAIDGNPSTAWTTQTYDGDNLGKPGVGIYVDARPGVAAGSMTLDTQTPGYAVTIYARNSRPSRRSFDTGHGGWMKVGSAPDVHPVQHIALVTGGSRYRFYLVWITSLGRHPEVAVNEIALYTRA